MACRLALALLTVALIPACSSTYYDPYLVQRDRANAPRMDSSRKVDSQDCTHAVAVDQGNLNCK